MIYLLDLNYTLVANSPKRGDPPIRPFIRQIEQEEYRQWLIELLRPHPVILITARPNRYQEVTLARIKEHLLKTYILPKYGAEGSGYFGFESNPHTRAMYARYGINAIKVTDQELMWIPS